MLSEYHPKLDGSTLQGFKFKLEWTHANDQSGQKSRALKAAINLLGLGWNSKESSIKFKIRLQIYEDKM